MTSEILWLIRIIEIPLLLILRIILKSFLDSSGVKTAVGSSNIKISAFKYNDFKISTHCCSPTERSRTKELNFRSISYSRQIALNSFSDFSKSKVHFSELVPTMIFSKTVKSSTRTKC